MTETTDRASANASASSPHPAVRRMLVWDLPVRVFHWSLVATFLAAWLTGGSGARLHEIAGYTVSALVLFRLIWGVAGSRHARFADFVVGPRRLFGYLRDMVCGRAPRYVGHNPAGGTMILALVAALIVVCVTGVMQMTNRYYGIEWVEEVHHAAANALVVLVPLHVLGAIASSLMHRENLIGAMISGMKPAIIPGHAQVDHGLPTRRQELRTMIRGAQGFSLLLFMTAAGLAYGWIATSGKTSMPVEQVASAPGAAAPATGVATAADIAVKQVPANVSIPDAAAKPTPAPILPLPQMVAERPSPHAVRPASATRQTFVSSLPAPDADGRRVEDMTGQPSMQRPIDRFAEADASVVAFAAEQSRTSRNQPGTRAAAAAVERERRERAEASRQPSRQAIRQVARTAERRESAEARRQGERRERLAEGRRDRTWGPASGLGVGRPVAQRSPEQRDRATRWLPQDSGGASGSFGGGGGSGGNSGSGNSGSGGGGGSGSAGR